MSLHNIPFSLKTENHPKLSQICSCDICSKGFKNEFQTAVVSQPSVLEPLKFCLYTLSAFCENLSFFIQVQQNLGYCPQFDALIDQMTGEETLYMYARLRGIENSQIPSVVQSLIETLMLKKHATKQAGVYR